jgi:hypothetical protein
MAHGTTLNELVKKVDTEYFSILDADAIWLKKHWDKILIKHFNHSIKAIGTEPPITKGTDFPLMFCILFETKTFMSLNINFCPKDIQKSEDTGHELRIKYQAAGFEGKVIEYKNTRTFHRGPFRKLLGVGEYYLDEDYSQIFCSHFGRGSSLGKAKYAKASKFYKLPWIGKQLLHNRGKREKKHWIKFCKNIVSKQLKG